MDFGELLKNSLEVQGIYEMGEIKWRREDWGMEFRKYRFVIFGWGSTAENEKQVNLRLSMWK